MDKTKRITLDELRDVAARTGFNQALITKDYYVTILLYLMKNIKGVYFKGGTALQKIFLNYSRLSEDIDFTVTRDVNSVVEEIEKAIHDCKIFGEVTKDKNVHLFTRLIVNYKDQLGSNGTVFIDLNQKAKLLLKTEEYLIPHFYPEHIPKFSVTTLNSKELFAEKMAATIGRNKPRDHFDLYQIISRKIPLDLKLVEKKCKASGDEYDITKMFNRTKKLKKRWDDDMNLLLAKETSFVKVMKTLAKHFKLNEGKDIKKEEKKEEV